MASPSIAWQPDLMGTPNAQNRPPTEEWWAGGPIVRSDQGDSRRIWVVVLMMSVVLFAVFAVGQLYFNPQPPTSTIPACAAPC